jgi:uncharacterized protein
MQPMPQQPMSEAELDQLANLLNDLHEDAMNLEMLDGFFAALICCPELVPPNEYLPHILGADFSFSNVEQANEIIGLMMRHWNTIATALLRTLDFDDVYLPVLLQDDDDIAHANDWANGFMYGVGLRPQSWKELIVNEENFALMLPTMILYHEHDPDPATRSPELTPEKREEILRSMIANLTHIYRYFEPHRRAQSAALMPVRRETVKVGRNDPCPCGSGRKFKHCCANGNNAGPTVH